MARKERLPKYVSSFIDTRGKRRYRFRKTGHSGGYFEAHPNSPAGQAEYQAFVSGGDRRAIKPREVIRGSIDDLLSRYYGSTAFRGSAQEHSLAKRRAVLEAFRAKHGHRPAATASYDKLDKYIAEVAVQWTDEKGRKHGGPFAAETARKLIRGLFKFAVKIQWRADNPMDHVEYRPKKTKGYHSWTEAEVGQYQAHWPLGTKQRLALELMLWTAKRRSDAIAIGPQHVEGDELVGRDKKTDKKWSLWIAPQLRQAIDAMPQAEHLCYIPSRRGRPYSPASFGNMFRKWCNDAGLPHCSAHGLRKATSRRLAEANVGNAGIKSVTLHSRDEEVSLYVAAADQKRLARAAIERISERHLSNAEFQVRQSKTGNDAK